MVNTLLMESYLHHSKIILIPHKEGWIKGNGELDDRLYYKDKVHLVEAGYMKLADSVNNAMYFMTQQCPRTDCYSPIIYRDTVQRIAFMSIEGDFPALTKLEVTPFCPEESKLFSSIVKLSKGKTEAKAETKTKATLILWHLSTTCKNRIF